jgi:hypothetical protein
MPQKTSREKAEEEIQEKASLARKSELNKRRRGTIATPVAGMIISVLFV